MAFPIGAHGFPLPDIRTWNECVGDIQGVVAKTAAKHKLPQPVLRGSVDDLVSGSCGHCSNELIRQLMGQGLIFSSAVIYCWRGVNSKDHPQEYWVEVWPNANTDRSSSHGMKEREAGCFQLSSPLIPESYTLSAIFWHQHMSLDGVPGDYGLTFSEKPITDQLPEPIYVHKRAPG